MQYFGRADFDDLGVEGNNGGVLRAIGLDDSDSEDRRSDNHRYLRLRDSQGRHRRF
jgi:hypothetical protein